MNAASPRALPAGQAEHPAPHRNEVPAWLVWACLLAPPGVWLLQLSIETVLAGRACYPRDTPLLQPALALGPLLLACDLVALVVAAASGLLAWRNWRATAGEKPGNAHHLMESGDGRTRFMSMAGVLTSGLILLASAYALASHLTLGGCGT